MALRVSESAPGILRIATIDALPSGDARSSVVVDLGQSFHGIPYRVLADHVGQTLSITALRSAASPAPQPDPVPRRMPLSHALIGAWVMACGYCIVAAVPLGLLGLWSAARALGGRRPELTGPQFVAVLGTVFGSYFLAATVVAPIVALLDSSRRRGVLGWILTGALVVPLIYGTVALTAYTMWEPGGRLLFGGTFGDRSKLLDTIPVLVGVTSLAGAVAGPYFRRQFKEGAG